MCKACNGISRRSFAGSLGVMMSGTMMSGTLATGVMATGLVPGGSAVVAAQENGASATGMGRGVPWDAWDAQPPVRIYVVYLGTGGAWPKPEFDASAEIANVFVPRLTTAAVNLGDVEFIGGDLVGNSVAAVETLLPKIAEQQADAILVVHLAFGNAAPFATLVATGLPVAVYSQPFSGHDWMYVPAMQRAGAKIIFSPSRDASEVERLAGLLRVPVKMRRSRLILVGNPGSAAGTAAACDFDQVAEKFGTRIIQVTPTEFVEVHGTVSEEEAVDEAERYWLSVAREIREPSRDEIVKSCKTYLAMRKLMRDNGARGLTMKCLGGVPIDVLGYPCLGFSRILDDGAVGACEADIDSSLTMLMMVYGTGMPGFITDPLIDLATNSAIHAHCTAPTKMDGIYSERLPFSIRTHRDDNLGASTQVFMNRDLGREVTWGKVANNNTLLVATGIMREICDFDDRGCRTQVVTEVTSSSARELFEKWGAGVLGSDMMTLLHRVLFYGNHLDNFRDIAQLMGLRLMIEGRDMV